jgi:hypothetical protein
MGRASKQLKVAMRGHPPRSRHMRLIRAVRSIKLLARIDSQDDPRDFAPVRPFCIRIQTITAYKKIEICLIPSLSRKMKRINLSHPADDA